MARMLECVILACFVNSQSRREGLSDALERLRQLHPPLMCMSYDELGYMTPAQYEQEWLTLRGFTSLLRPLCNPLGVFV